MKKFLLSLPILIGLTTISYASQCVHASYYGKGFHGRKTANGEIFNKNGLTAAHKTLPFNTRLRVTHNGKSVIVRINDRGPFIKGRSIDLSEGAAKQIGMYVKGVGKICYTLLNNQENQSKKPKKHMKKKK